MKRRTKGILLIGSLAVASVAGTLGLLTTALAKIVDPGGYCETGFSSLVVPCQIHWSSRTISQGKPIFPVSSGEPAPFQPTYTEVTSWAVAQCPRNRVAKRLACAVAADAVPAQAASDDLASHLPRPKPWILTTGKSSPFIEAVHVETPLDFAATLSFYRAALAKRGWTENEGAGVASDTAVIAFTTSDGPALLRVNRWDDRTIVDLSRRKAGAPDASIQPEPGHMRLLLGNDTDEGAVITVNDQAVTLAARAGGKLTENPGSGRKASDSGEISLLPGKHNVTIKRANGDVQNRVFDVAAGETWACWSAPKVSLSPYIFIEVERPSSFEFGRAAKSLSVMPGLVPGIHVFASIKRERRGWPGQARP